MKYQTGKTYIAPQLPGSVMAEIGKHLLFDPKEFTKENMIQTGPGRYEIHRYDPISLLPFSGNDTIPSTSAVRRIVFKKQTMAFDFWICESGDV